MASTGKVEAFLAEPRNVIVAGIRRDGRPHLSPNWFYWDGQRFYVSTTRDRVKYAIFRRDPRAQLLVDDPAGFRAVLVPATVELDELGLELTPKPSGGCVWVLPPGGLCFAGRCATDPEYCGSGRDIRST